MMITISKKDTPNQYELWGKVEAIILHTTLGAYEGAIDWLTTSPQERQRKTGVKSYSSAHFIIGRKGEITQLAGLTKGTWHAGAVSKPSDRAKKALPKSIWGKIKNPNRYTIGIEFATGYDIDRDGIIESWEKLYTIEQVQACAQLIRLIDSRLGNKLRGDKILTHRDVNISKPDLEIQRLMILNELKRLDLPPVISTPEVEKIDPKEVQLEVGKKYEVLLLDKKKFITFKEITS